MKTVISVCSLTVAEGWLAYALGSWLGIVVQFLSHFQLFATPWSATCQASPSFTISEFAQAHVHWVGDAIQSSDPVIPFSSCLRSFPASGSFPMSWLFALGGQSITVSTSASVLPMNIQGWFPLGLTGLISLKFKGLSRVFSNTTVQNYQFFCDQPSLWSNSNTVHDYWKTITLTIRTFVRKVMPSFLNPL